MLDLAGRSAYAAMTPSRFFGSRSYPGKTGARFVAPILSARIPVRGNLVPDAHLAAILQQHGVRTLYTNEADFRKFDFLEIRDRWLEDRLRDEAEPLLFVEVVAGEHRCEVLDAHTFG